MMHAVKVADSPPHHPLFSLPLALETCTGTSPPACLAPSAAGRPVGRKAHGQSRSRQPIRRSCFCQAEVHQLRAALREHDIAWLQVTVGDSGLVRLLQPLTNLDTVHFST